MGRVVAPAVEAIGPWLTNSASRSSSQPSVTLLGANDSAPTVVEIRLTAASGDAFDAYRLMVTTRRSQSGHEVLGRTDLSMQSQARANAASSVGATTLSIPGT